MMRGYKPRPIKDIALVWPVEKDRTDLTAGLKKAIVSDPYGNTAKVYAPDEERLHVVKQQARRDIVEKADTKGLKDHKKNAERQERNRIDYSKDIRVKLGKTFNSWTIIGKARQCADDTGRQLWRVRCRCKCGKEQDIEVRRVVGTKKATMCLSCSAKASSAKSLATKRKQTGSWHVA